MEYRVHITKLLLIAVAMLPVACEADLRRDWAESPREE